MKFKAYNFTIKQLKDAGIRLTMDISLDEWDNVKEIPKLEVGIYEVEIEPEIEEVKVGEN